MKNWIEKAKSLLHDSIYPVPAELNPLDWKSGLSPDNERLAQHICAFANYKGGGVFAFGVKNEDASLFSVSKEEADDIITRLGNIASNRLYIPIQLEHSIEDFEGHAILFVYVPEQIEKPVFLRGGTIYDSYYRSAGQTRKMTKSQVRAMIAQSQGLPFEFMTAKDGLTADKVLSLLDFNKFLELSKKSLPQELKTVVSMMADYHLCEEDTNGWAITNLGALLFANNLSDFAGLTGKAIIIRKYTGNSNLELDFERKSTKGYAVELEDLIDFISDSTPSREIIESIREKQSLYPKVAIREILANAMAHQDLFETGMAVTVEIYQDRIAITNPGSCLNDITRIIDLPPHSRNEKLAEALFLFGICEKRGSGMDRAVAAIEAKCLPPIKITSSDSHTRAFIYAPKKWSKMSFEERIQACYQHTCLLYERNVSMTNQSLRERLGMERRATAPASRIINDTVQRGLIKPANAENESKKLASYIPFYG
ncbi:MAG: putative DNA binding domain-containing protein [Bacteroidales bacterium]|nr:putative DNA binding domain-containing protein [Bacteroidales bacterium]